MWAVDGLGTWLERTKNVRCSNGFKFKKKGVRQDLYSAPMGSFLNCFLEVESVLWKSFTSGS